MWHFWNAMSSLKALAYVSPSGTLKTNRSLTFKPIQCDKVPIQIPCSQNTHFIRHDTVEFQRLPTPILLNNGVGHL